MGAIAALGAVGCAGAVAAVACTIAAAITCPIACPVASTIRHTVSGAVTRTNTVAAGLENLLSIATTKIHAIASPGLQIVVAEAVSHVLAGIFHALTMRRIVLPTIPDVVDLVEVIDIDVAVPPVEPPPQ